MSLPLAHAGHWYQSVLYAAPLILLLVWMVVDRLRRGRGRRGGNRPK